MWHYDLQILFEYVVHFLEICKCKVWALFYESPDISRLSTDYDEAKHQKIISEFPKSLGGGSASKRGWKRTQKHRYKALHFAIPKIQNRLPSVINKIIYPNMITFKVLHICFLILKDQNYPPELMPKTVITFPSKFLWSKNQILYIVRY